MPTKFDELRSGANIFWYLKDFNIFENFSKQNLEEVTELVQVEEFKKGRSIVLPQEKERRVYFLLKGKVKIAEEDQVGREIIIAILGEGEIFGPIIPLSECDTPPSVIALEPCLIGHIREKDFDHLVEANPDLCFEISKYIGEQLIKLTTRLKELIYQDIPVRLARILLHLAEDYPREDECGVVIDVRLTQQEIASLIGATRESTSSNLNQFKRNGWIESEGRDICIKNRKALEKLANQ